MTFVVRAADGYSTGDRDQDDEDLALEIHGYHPAPFVVVFTRQRYMSAQM